MDDDGFEGLDEGPIVDSGAVVVGIWVPTDVTDDDVNGFESGAGRPGLLGGPYCGGEDDPTDTAGIG